MEEELTRMIKRLIEFPYARICKHSIAADLLSLLNDHGYLINEDLADAIVNAKDEKALKILNQIST